MVGPTAQLVALACHFNSLSYGIPVATFFPDNSTCQYCEYIHFLKPHRRWFSTKQDWQVTANNPEEWFATEYTSNRRAYLLHSNANTDFISDRMSAGFIGGGGRWFLALMDGRSMDCWEAGWKVGDPDAVDRRIWQVNYALVSQNVRPVDLHASTLDQITHDLTIALSEIRAFAVKQGLSHFADMFATAGECLVSTDPFALVYHKDLAPPGILTLAASRILACVQAAWVFGGMGSWNDMGFEDSDQQEYEKLSDTLFNVLNQAICAATNSSAQAQGLQ